MQTRAFCTGFLFIIFFDGNNLPMKRQYQNLDVIKQKINQLKGKDVKIRLNKGRNKIQFFKGRINETYSSVFVIQIFDSVFDRLSCTYQDVLCGDVKFKLIEKV